MSLLPFQTPPSFPENLCDIPKSEFQACFPVGGAENRMERPKLLLLLALCPSVTLSEFLSQLNCSDCASLLPWLFSCSLHHSSFPQGRARAGGCLLTVKASHGEQCQESGLGTGDYQTLTRNSPHSSLRNDSRDFGEPGFHRKPPCPDVNLSLALPSYL